jgi:GNAT superfamily N-acetyltransferase
MTYVDVEGERGPVSTDQSAPVIRRVDERDWAHLKSVRLTALAESPSAFGSTLEREQQYDERDWRAWARDVATFLAFHRGAPVGIAAGVEGDRAGERKLIAMWVHPDHRGTGVGSALLGAVRAWARDDGAAALTLWVTRTNDAAANLYLRTGFTATGDSKPLPSNPALTEDKLTLDLG